MSDFSLSSGVTAMLLATTINLIVFRSPSAFVSIMWLISAKIFIKDTYPFRWRRFHSISNLCALFNAATTFVLFIIYGTKFRSEFMRVYCCLIRRTKARASQSERENDEYRAMCERPSYSYAGPRNTSIHSFKRTEEKSRLNVPTNRSSNDTYISISQTNSVVTTCTTTPTTTLLVPKNHSNHYLDGKEQLTCLRTPDMNQSSTDFGDATDSCLGEQNSKKTLSIAESYHGWLKKLVSCR